jgi:hypothetical protein
VILTQREAAAFVYGDHAEAVAVAVCHALAEVAAEQAGPEDAIVGWCLAREGGDPGLEAFSAAVDVLSWEAVTILKGERRAA